MFFGYFSGGRALGAFPEKAFALGVDACWDGFGGKCAGRLVS